VRNCFGFLRKVNAGFLPLRCLSEGDGDGDASDAVTSDRKDMPDTFRCVLFLLGVDALRKTASR